MNYLDGMIKLVEKELAAIDGNGKFRTREEIDSVYKLVDIAKDIYCIWNYESEMEDMSEEGESYRGGRSNRGSYNSNRGSYEDGMSSARGRGRNARRDSMGRYSREGSYRSYRGYSRDGKEEYIEELREMMESAPDEQTRQSIQRMLQQMENQ